MPLQIVRPSRDDYKELHQLFSVTIRDAFAREGVDTTFADEIPEEIQFQLDALNRDFDSGGRDEYFLIARTSSGIVGTAAYGITTDGVSEALDVGDNYVPEVKSVYVLPQAQGRGIGSKLFDSIITQMSCAGISEFSLECGYKRAQAFWKRRLGEPIVVYRDYFAEDAHLMFWRCKIERFLQP